MGLLCVSMIPPVLMLPLLVFTVTAPPTSVELPTARISSVLMLPLLAVSVISLPLPPKKERESRTSVVIEPLELVKVISPPLPLPLKALIQPVCRLFPEEMLISPPFPLKKPAINAKAPMFPVVTLPDEAERVTFPAFGN